MKKKYERPSLWVMEVRQVSVLMTSEKGFGGKRNAYGKATTYDW